MKGIHLIAIVMLTASIFAATHIPIEKQIPYEDKESYFVDVPYQKPIYKTVEHSDPVYDTVEQYSPIYDTMDHSEPIYETLYNVVLIDGSTLGDEVYRKSNVYNIKKVRTGSDFWGNSEYMFTLYYYISIPDGRKTYNTYYEIDEWSSVSYEATTGYNVWSEEIVIGYDTWTEEVVIGYDTWTEEVVDRYETAYRPEKRYRTVTKHMPITKPVWEWIDIWVNGKKLPV